jgi:hypothetical protein
MANKGRSVAIDGEKLLKTIEDNGYSIRELAKHEYIDRSERTIRYGLKENRMQTELLFNICWVLLANPDDYIVDYSDPILQETNRMKAAYFKWYADRFLKVT